VHIRTSKVHIGSVLVPKWYILEPFSVPFYSESIFDSVCPSK